VAEYIKFTHALAEEIGIRLPSFGHAGDGNIHIYLCRDSLDDTLWEQKKAAVFDELYRRAAEIGGQVSGEHGIGHAKRQYLREHLGEEQIALMRRIKKAFDPLNLLNPGKIF
jgi:glycolate oxidase